jgi:hypothetical protein
MKSNPRTHQSMSSDRPLGSREDGSALISLSSLAAQAVAGQAATRREQSPRNDDSGLIDLKALEAAAQAAENAPSMPLAHVHVPIFPFGSPEPAPMVAKEEPAVEMPEKKSRKGRWIAGVVGAALVSAFAIGAASAGPKGTPVMLGARLAPAFEVAAKQANTVEIARPQEATQPEVKAPSEKAGEPAARSKVPGTRPNQRTEPKQNEPGKTDTGKTKTPPPPAESCDLMCQMRRATGQK